MVFWTFLWAWWVVTKIRVENYFVDTWRSIVDARQVGYGRTLWRLVRTHRKFQIGLVLILVSGGVLVWAAVSDQQESSQPELRMVEPYLMVPAIDSVETDTLLQVDRQ